MSPRKPEWTYEGCDAWASGRLSGTHSTSGALQTDTACNICLADLRCSNRAFRALRRRHQWRRHQWRRQPP
eukprot:1341128-Alexandrium_andersonii.AAC.1